MKRIFLVLAAVAVVCISMQWMPSSELENYHTSIEKSYFKIIQDSLPVNYNGLFSGSGACVNCHGHDPAQLASVTSDGTDVNVVDAWGASIMANSAKDPYWRAKVKESVIANPAHQQEIENSCTTCHAPLGRYTASMQEDSHYSMEMFLTDSLGQDGVSCVACHQQVEENIGQQFSGELTFSETPVAFGQYQSPLISPMALATGYVPTYADHIQTSKVCAGCHTLITNTVDLAGDYTGTQFIEQSTYHEWLNSDYNEDNLNITCQNCHMPSLGSKQPIKLVAGFDTPPRAPFSLHTFAGANSLMLSILNENKEVLGVAATSEDFDASIDATMSMLQSQSLSLSTELVERTTDTLIAKANLRNLAGHKFPSGYPARRLFVQATLYNTDGEVLWQSGEWDDDFYLSDEDDGYEPHYNVIRNENEVQIYEMVMGDVNGNYTSLLERANSKLKDNRLVPRGFSISHASYDTTTVVGAAFEDADFNFQDGSEGTGGDELEFRIPIVGIDAEVVLEVNAYYQAIPPKFVEELFDYDDPDIEAFESMYMAADRTPVLVRSTELIVDEFVGIEESDLNPKYLSHVSGSQYIGVSIQGKSELSIYTYDGRLVQKELLEGGNEQLLLSVSGGIYLAVLETDDIRETRKIFVKL